MTRAAVRALARKSTVSVRNQTTAGHCKAVNASQNGGSHDPKDSPPLRAGSSLVCCTYAGGTATGLGRRAPQQYPGCKGFNITFTATGGNQAERLFRDRGGVIYTITGGHGTVLTVRNATTGKSVTFPTNGSVTKITSYPDGTADVQLTGKNLFILFPTDNPGPSTILYTGRVTFSNDANGVSTVKSTSGTQRDICAELAP